MDTFIRQQQNITETKLDFQILSWEAFDEVDEYSDSEDPIIKYNIYKTRGSRLDIRVYEFKIQYKKIFSIFLIFLIFFLIFYFFYFLRFSRFPVFFPHISPYIPIYV